MSHVSFNHFRFLFLPLRSDPTIELRTIDWFHEKIEAKHYIVVLNDVELRLYDKLPASWAEWEQPEHVLPLLGTRSILEKGNLTCIIPT